MRIYDGRDSFYQWDINQKLTSTNLKVGDEIHITNSRQSIAPVLIAYEFNGKVVVDVPNNLLQMAIPLIVYRYVNDGKSGYTVEEYTFTVNQRPKPDDYVYTETEVLTYAALEKRVSDLENGSSSGGGANIDDTAISANTTWSSQKINTELGDVETALDGIIALQNQRIREDIK